MPTPADPVGLLSRRTGPRRSPQIRSAESLSELGKADLSEAVRLTEQISSLQEEIKRLSAQRRRRVLSVYEEGATYKVIASALRSSNQLVYKIVRGDL